MSDLKHGFYYFYRNKDTKENVYVKLIGSSYCGLYSGKVDNNTVNFCLIDVIGKQHIESEYEPLPNFPEKPDSLSDSEKPND
jgi:hypothetical protein